MKLKHSQKQKQFEQNSLRQVLESHYDTFDSVPDKQQFVGADPGLPFKCTAESRSIDSLSLPVSSRHTRTVSFASEVVFDKQYDGKDNTAENEEKFAELSGRRKAKFVALLLLRVVGLVTLLYFFTCSLDLLSTGFTLIGGRTTGSALKSPLLNNRVCGLMIGVVSTAFLQSSSTSTSIVIAMVASNILSVRIAIPIIMGANIGTSVTGILVSVAHAGDREQFERAFTAATAHDMFNWLTVIVLLPMETGFQYLERVTTAIVNSTQLAGGGKRHEFLKVITKPFTNLIVQVDRGVLDDIAAGDPGAQDKPLLRYWCVSQSVPDYPTDPPQQPSNVRQEGNDLLEEVIDSLTQSPIMTTLSSAVPTKIIGIHECRYLFHGTTLPDKAVGGLVLLMSLTILIVCLVCMVKILKGLLQGSMARVIQRTINADFPGRLAFLTGYVTILVGTGITILVQSSSVLASALTPLVGLGVVTVERVFPMLLGANMGTTSTTMLAAFAASGNRVTASFQIALCHLFFNLTGIVLWYPIPFMRRVPLGLAKFLGKTTSVYRWFAVVYLVLMFLLLPGIVLALSIPGWQVLAGVGGPFIALLVAIGLLNTMQRYRPQWLPGKLRTWEFLPRWMTSLQPYDAVISKLVLRCSCCRRCRRPSNESLTITEEMNQKPEEPNLQTLADCMKHSRNSLLSTTSTLVHRETAM